MFKLAEEMVFLLQRNKSERTKSVYESMNKKQSERDKDNNQFQQY